MINKADFTLLYFHEDFSSIRKGEIFMEQSVGKYK